MEDSHCDVNSEEKKVKVTGCSLFFTVGSEAADSCLVRQRSIAE